MGAAGVELCLLGPLEVRFGGRLLDVGPARQRGVLAVLLLAANRNVSTDQVVERVWGDRRLPESPRSAVQTYVSLLRRALAETGQVTIVRQSSGYRIDVDERLVDVYEFRRLVEQARTTDADGSAAELFERALGLWRGEALGTLDTPWFNSVRVALERERHVAERDATDVQLRRGRHGALIARLSGWLEEHPLDERLAGQLMLALFRNGRQADALKLYQQMRGRLVAELGADPGRALRQLQHQILTHDPALALVPAPENKSAPRGTGPAQQDAVQPRQLPAANPHFTGRADELKALTNLAGQTDRPRGTVVITGTAGIGKTALAVCWGHQAAEHFPDGQLYVNLRGFAQTGAAVQPGTAVRGFLTALGIAPARIPTGLDEQAALYRSLLADRRMLVVLDNAGDTDQIRPLLPGAAGCMVLVTSRNRLTGLVAVEGAHPLALDLLSAGEARDLLSRRFGAERVGAEPDPAEALIGLCARLPLALNIVAAHAAAHPGLPLAALAARLRGAPGPLAALDAGDVAANVRAVLSWSYHALGAREARMFRLLGLHPGPDITAAAAAGLAESDLEQARAALDELTAAHLLTEPVPGRYAFHDLLRAYAAELVETCDTAEEREAALHRCLDYYLHTAFAAERRLNPARPPITPSPPRPGAAPETPADDEEAWAWLEAEIPVLLAACAQAAAAPGFDTHAYQLPWTLGTFLDRRGEWQHLATTQTTALAAALRLGDVTETARAHRNLGNAYSRLGRFEDAHTQLEHALELSRRLEDHGGQAGAHQSLAWVLEQQGRHAEALEHAQQTLELFRATGNRGGEVAALNMIGWYHSLLGDYQQAVTFCRQSLDLRRELGDMRNGEAETWDSLGYAHHHLGDHEQAIACYDRALDLFTEKGDRYNQAVILDHLGDCHEATGSAGAAREAWQRALAVLDDLEHPGAAQIRAKLSTLS